MLKYWRVLIKSKGTANSALLTEKLKHHWFAKYIGLEFQWKIQWRQTMISYYPPLSWWYSHPSIEDPCMNIFQNELQGNNRISGRRLPDNFKIAKFLKIFTYFSGWCIVAGAKIRLGAENVNSVVQVARQVTRFSKDLLSICSQENVWWY